MSALIFLALLYRLYCCIAVIWHYVSTFTIYCVFCLTVELRAFLLMNVISESVYFNRQRLSTVYFILKGIPMSFLNRFHLGFIAVLLCMVALLAIMFSVPNVAPEAVVQATVEQVAPVAPAADPAPAAVDTEPVYPTTMANAATDRYPASTLWGIAARECGNGSRWTDILVLNNLERPEDLQPGVVKLPPDCTLHARPIIPPSSSKSIKTSAPAAPEHKAPAVTAPKGPQAEVKVPPASSTHQTRGFKPSGQVADSAADDDFNTEIVLFNCSKPRPSSAMPEGKYLDRWIAQCGKTYFSGPGVYEDVELYEDGTITRARVADYQLRQAAELKARMDYLWSLMARNPERNVVGMGMIRLSYHGDSSNPGLKDIATLTWVDADYVLSFAEDKLEYYTDEWVREQRRQGAFFAPFWRKVFSYTETVKPTDLNEESHSEALVAGS